MESSAQWRPVTRGDSVLPCPPGGSQFQMAQLVGAEEHVARLAEPHILGVPMGCTPGPSCRPRGNGDQNQECPAQPSPAYAHPYAHHLIMGLGCLALVLQRREDQRGKGSAWPGLTAGK